jgi:hypothetical protein
MEVRLSSLTSAMRPDAIALNAEILACVQAICWAAGPAEV